MKDWTRCFEQLPPEGVEVEVQTNTGHRCGVREGNALRLRAFAAAPEATVPIRTPYDTPSFTVRWRLPAALEAAQ